MGSRRSPSARGRLWALALAPLLAGCGDESVTHPEPTPEPEPPVSCEAGERAHPDGGCCPAGTTFSEAGLCQPAGVPAAACAEGFEPDGAEGCEPVLPAEACGPGLMAIAGEASCREVAPCGSGPWGDIPVEASTQHVDGAYGGGSCDGSSDRPWTSIQQAIEGAAAGSIVAIAAGHYGEAVVVQGKPVRLWGRCPAMVEIAGTDSADVTVTIGPGSQGSELRALAVTSADEGIVISGATEVALERLWVHDTGDRALRLTMVDGPADAMLRDSLIETVVRAGAHVQGAALTIERSVLRDVAITTAGNSGRGILVMPGAADAPRAMLTLRRSIVERCAHYGVTIRAADALIEASVIRDGVPDHDGWYGRGLDINEAMSPPVPANVTVRSSFIANNTEAGLFVSGSDVLVDSTVVRDTRPDGYQGLGAAVAAYRSLDLALRSRVTVSSSVLRGSHMLGAFVVGSDLTLEGSVVRATAPHGSGGQGRGIYVESDLPTQERASVTLIGSRVEDNHEVAVMAIGSDAHVDGSVLGPTIASGPLGQGRGLNVEADVQTSQWGLASVRSSLVTHNAGVGVFGIGTALTIHDTVVSDTQPSLTVGAGRGIAARRYVEADVRGLLEVTGSLVQRSILNGIYVHGSDATVTDTIVDDTQPIGADHTFGDGISVLSTPEQLGAIDVAGGRISNSARVGLSLFGARAALAGVRLDCNVIDLNGEDRWRATDVDMSTPYVLEDRGENWCGCGPTEHECTVRSAGVQPPPPPPQY